MNPTDPQQRNTNNDTTREYPTYNANEVNPAKLPPLVKKKEWIKTYKAQPPPTKNDFHCHL